MKLLGYIGLDQNGEYYHMDKYPRKELLEQLGRRGAEKMYMDTVDGGHRHVGYVIAGRWIRIYKVSEWKEPEGGN